MWEVWKIETLKIENLQYWLYVAVMSQVHSVQVQVQVQVQVLRWQVQVQVQVLSSKYKYEYKYLYSQVRYIQIQASD